MVVSYGQLIPKNFLNIPKYGCINIHVSLLPRWRGAAPIEHALLSGDVKTGISIISVSPKLDAGDILMQESFALDTYMNSDDLTVNLTNLGKKILMKFLPLLFKNKIIRKKQDESLVTYANKFLSKIDRLILQLPFTEFHTGFRIYGKQFNRMPFEKFSDDYLLSFEVIAFAAFMNFKSAEVPVECDYIDDHTSHSYIGASIYAIQHFLTLFRFLPVSYTHLTLPTKA